MRSGGGKQGIPHPRDALEGLYETIKNLPAGIIADQAAIPEETADQLLPMLVIYQRMMDFAMAPAILSPACA